MKLESDRGAYRLVARREFVERARDRSFLISTAITVLVLMGFIIGNSLLRKSGTHFDLGVQGAASRIIAQGASTTAQTLGFQVTVHEFGSEKEAEAALRKGSVDAVLVDDAQVLVKQSAPDQLLALLQAISARERTRETLERTGLPPDRIQGALDVRPLPVRALEPVDERRRQNAVVAFVGVLALYGQLFAYGYWVASGVVEEKASRVIEVLLATIRPSQLLRGKILGIGILGLCQLMLIGGAGVVAARTVGSLRFPAGAVWAIGVVLLWFVLGYFFYATLFAVAGAIVPRQEDLQATMTPLTIVIIGSFFIGITAVQNPSSSLAAVASFLPFSAPLVMPTRMVLGQLSAWHALLSAAITVGATLALIPVATKVYSRAVLRTGRVRVREVLRTEP
jgi:ABC-2 type transport system permease protein